MVWTTSIDDLSDLDELFVQHRLIGELIGPIAIRVGIVNGFTIDDLLKGVVLSDRL